MFYVWSVFISQCCHSLSSVPFISCRAVYGCTPQFAGDNVINVSSIMQIVYVNFAISWLALLLFCPSDCLTPISIIFCATAVWIFFFGSQILPFLVLSTKSYLFRFHMAIRILWFCSSHCKARMYFRPISFLVGFLVKLILRCLLFSIYLLVY